MPRRSRGQITLAIISSLLPLLLPAPCILSTQTQFGLQRDFQRQQPQHAIGRRQFWIQCDSESLFWAFPVSCFPQYEARGHLISLSKTEEIMQNLVKMKHSCPICEFLDDILGFARLKPNLTLSQTGSGSKSYLTACKSRVVSNKHFSTYKYISTHLISTYPAIDMETW